MIKDREMNDIVKTVSDLTEISVSSPIVLQIFRLAGVGGALSYNNCYKVEFFIAAC